MEKLNEPQVSTAANPGKRRSVNKPTLTELASPFILRDKNKAICRIDQSSGCKYVQENFDIGNFIRHFRARHTKLANAKGFLKEQEGTIKKPRTAQKRPIAIDKQLLIDSAIKLVTYHNMPLSCFDWEGLKQLLSPIEAAIGVCINRSNIKDHLRAGDEKIREYLKEEMRGRLISIKIDSASRYGRCVLGIIAQYTIDDAVVVRTLGMLEVTQRQTAQFLKSKVLEIVQSYGVTLEQIFSVTCDNGANMVAAVKLLKKALEVELMKDTDDSDADDQDQKITESLSQEFQGQLNLVRCAAHTIQLAVLDVVNKSHDSVKQITDIVKRCKQIKFKTSFELYNASYPPIWSQTRWSGIYKMMESITKQEAFFRHLAEEFPELDLSNHWTFIHHYEAAFRPLYICTKKMQATHLPLSECYIQWLMVISELRKLESNPFVQPLIESLTNRLTNLRTSRAFKMAIYLDPRFTYLGSKIFSSEEKELVQAYVVELWDRICQLNPQPPTEKICQGSGIVGHDFDNFLTEMFGGTLSTSSSLTGSTFMEQLKALDVGQRQSHDLDVWKHWVERKITHPELYAVAMIVLATPATQVTVERAFSGLALVLTSHRSTLAEETLADILSIKLNKELYEKLLPTLYDWQEDLPNLTCVEGGSS